MRRLVLALTGGVTLALAFPDVGWWWAALIGPGLLYTALRHSTMRAGFGYGWLFGLAFFLPHLWWAYVAVGPVPWVALSAAEAVATGLVGAFFSLLHGRDALRGLRLLEPLAFGVLWVAAELARSTWPFGGFPWGRVAFATSDSLLLRYAWLGGAPLVSLVVVVCSALLAQALIAWRWRQPLAGLAIPLVVGGLLIAPVMLPLDGTAQSGRLTVAWVQGNLANEGLDSFARAREVTRNHVDATLALAAAQPDAKVDLIVWPENASDIDPRADAQTAAAVTEAAQAFGAPLLLGTNDYSPPEGRYNLDLVWLPSGAQLEGQEYRKQVPAAFAEYIPIRSFARLFSSEVDRVTRDMIPGDLPAHLDIPIESVDRPVRVGTIICFEVAYDWISRESASEGAEFLAVQTNNATFGVTPESTQQLAMSRLRAVETGRATLQVSTVGVSAVISPTGEVLDSASLFTRDAGIAQIPLRTAVTPATRWGREFEWGIQVLALILMFASVAAPRIRRTH